MTLWNLFQGHIGLAVLHRGHEAPALTLGLEHLAACLEVGIQLRQSLPEVVDAALKVAVRHEKMLFYILLYGFSCALPERIGGIPYPTAPYIYFVYIP